MLDHDVHSSLPQQRQCLWKKMKWGEMVKCPRVRYVFILNTCYGLWKHLPNTLWIRATSAATRLVVASAVIPAICAPLCVFPHHFTGALYPATHAAHTLRDKSRTLQHQILCEQRHAPTSRFPQTLQKTSVQRLDLCTPLISPLCPWYWTANLTYARQVCIRYKYVSFYGSVFIW